MSETTELRRKMELSFVYDDEHPKVGDRIVKVFYESKDSLRGEVRTIVADDDKYHMRLDNGAFYNKYAEHGWRRLVAIETHPTRPASEPSEQPKEQPVADAEDVVRNSLPISLAMTADFRERLAQVLAQPIREYARHASARAVEAERQRLARLVDEKVDNVRHHPELKDFDYGYAAALKQVKQWLAGEGEKR